MIASVKSFTRSNVGKIHEQVNAEIEAILKKYGYEFVEGHGTYSPNSFDFKFTMVIPDASGKPLGENELEQAFNMAGINYTGNLVNSVWFADGERWKITGYRIGSRSKYCVNAIKIANGKEYCLTVNAFKIGSQIK